VRLHRPTRHPRPARRPPQLPVVVLVVLIALPALAGAQTPVVYRLSFADAAHHLADVEVTFSGVAAGAPLRARMSRSSPGRYALHEFAKNVFDVAAFDGAGHPLRLERPSPSGWDVGGHDGTVRLRYRIYGDRVDGTYLGIDTTHAHLNMPATLMWAPGFERHPVEVHFTPPEGRGWTPATQLFPTADPWTFTAPNLQYLMDSPTELSAQTVRSFTVANPDGRTFTIRTALHHDATDRDVDDYVRSTERIVREAGAVFGEFPSFDTGTYTFLGDYVPWGGGDGMEHRNSTVVAAPVSIRGAVADVLDTVSHEFFHAWNVERIRPATLEPFDFERANMSGALWLAEGFTQYYGDLILHRAGLLSRDEALATFGGTVNAVINGAGRQFHSAVDMSRMAPFTDAATSIDRTNLSTTFISYYTYGAAIAIALDLSLRERSHGTVTLDDYMRAMWRVHGSPGGAEPGLVARPYTLRDARDRLAEVSGDRAFADDFFDRFVDGRETADYARLFAQAGLVFRPRRAGAAWMGPLVLDRQGVVANLIAPNTPAHAAGFDQDDRIVTIDGQAPDGNGLQAVLAAHAPGDPISIVFRHPDGTERSGRVVLGEDPAMELVPLEATGGTPTTAQVAFRDAWLTSRVK
jgi:predicted metalloprotease with PDZ domain